MGLGAFLINTISKGFKISPKTYDRSNFVIDGRPRYLDLSSPYAQLCCYETNPVVNAVINIKAEAFSNLKFKVKDLKSEEIFDLMDYDKDGGGLKKLLSDPNPLQSGSEWLKQFKLNYEVFGNGYNYASVPSGFNEKTYTYKDITVLNNLYAANVRPIITGNWLESTTIDEIIKHYEFDNYHGDIQEISPLKVMHINSSNLRLDYHFTEGVSDLVALQKPISNIDAAYESRNVLITRRGAIGMLSSEKRDEAMGNIALSKEEIDQVQKDYRRYGSMNGQDQLLISSQPLKYQKMALSVKELMLFEEIEADAIAVATAKKVPELLVKYYIKGGTFENLNASEKRLYDSTIIPESEAFISQLNKFLKTSEHNIQIIGSYDHVNVLQSNKKEEAEVKKTNIEGAEKAFRTGAIKYNDYLACMGMPNDPIIGDKRVWDLKENQLFAIGIGKTKESNQTNQDDE